MISIYFKGFELRRNLEHIFLVWPTTAVVRNRGNMVRNYKRKTEDRWSKEDLLAALCTIKDGKMKINDAAKHFGISRATLYRQYTKFLTNGSQREIAQFRTCGGNPILTVVEEIVLKDTVVQLVDDGNVVTSSDIKRICYEYCVENGVPNQFNVGKRMASDDWYYGFLKRHPDVKAKLMSFRKAKGLAPWNASFCEPDANIINSIQV